MTDTAPRPLVAPAGPARAPRPPAVSRPAAPLPPPAPPAVPAAALPAGGLVVAAVFAGAWLGHGGVADLRAGGSAAWASLTSLSGLVASLAGLAGCVLVARPRSMERRVGLDRLFVWHRWLGEAMAVALVVHVVAGVAAWGLDTGLTTALADLTGREPYMAMATVSALAVGLVTVTSLRSIRRRLSYETWWFVHLTAYAGLALSVPHTITIGRDLASETALRWLWVALHLAVAAALVGGRWGRSALAALRPLHVVASHAVGDGTVALRLGGRHLAGVRADAGQFFLLRPLVARLWWQPHPFSVSAAPTNDGLRFTVKDRGDASAAIAALPLGTRVAVEGPYGAVTPSVLTGKVAFVVGGVGVAPARSMLERLGPGASPVVLYRARSSRDLVHLEELQQLAAARGGRVLTLVGRTAALAVRDPFGAEALLAAVPDVAERDVVVCGPDSLLHAARRGLRAAGVPARRIHLESPWW